VSDEIAPLTPAEEHNLTLHPAAIEQATENPEVLIQMTRAQLAIVQDRMVRKVLGDASSSVTQLAVVHERLSKNAELAPKGPTGGPGAGAQVVINFVRGAGKEKVVIEAAPGGPNQAIDVTPA
jgi:uncharacterized protein YlzI (FlbEa/FlbD family)